MTNNRDPWYKTKDQLSSWCKPAPEEHPDACLERALLRATEPEKAQEEAKATNIAEDKKPWLRRFSVPKKD